MKNQGFTPSGRKRVMVLWAFTVVGLSFMTGVRCSLIRLEPISRSG
jgi:hypothetical protein